MWEQELKTICKKLKPIIGPRADALWIAYTTADTLKSKQDTQALIQMLGVQYLAKTVDDQSVLLPPPSQEAASGEFFLGTIIYGGKKQYPIYLRRENFIKHIGIFSITGGGKSNAAQILLLGLLHKQIPFLVVDWKRSYRALLTFKPPGG